MATPPGISKQLTDKVLEIVKDNKDISLEDIVLEMKKSVGLSFSVLQKLVNEILEWFEEGGTIVRMVDKRTKNAMFRMNENRSAAGTIVSESIKDLIRSGDLTEMTDDEIRAIHDKVTKGGKYLGTDKKFNRHWYEYKGQLWVHGDGSTFMTNNGSVGVPGNKKIINGLVKEEVSEGARETHKTLIRKGVVAPIDSTRHPERKGLEGPFRNKKTGKVFYYDPKEGKYYDPNSDIYLDVDDVMEETLHENRRLERFVNTFYTSEESLTESDYITEARGYRKVKDLDGTKSLWELRTLYGMSYLIVSYSPQVDETAVFKSDRNGKPLSYIEVYSTRGRPEPEPIIRDIASGKIKPMDEEKKETK